MAGKPFAKPTDAQRAAQRARDKADLFAFLGAVAEPAVMGGAKFLDTHPENVVSQIAHDPFVKATIQVAVGTAVRMRDEAEAAASAPVEAEVVPEPEPDASSTRR
jgi:hypothetical protein